MPRELSRVVYVDDEPHLRLVAQLALEKVGGFATLVCSSGQGLLDEGPGFAPDLILLDVMMPGMDGPGTLARARATAGLEEVPVVFVTAKTQDSEVARFRTLGCLDVIAKPFRPLELAGDIRAIWARRHAVTP